MLISFELKDYALIEHINVEFGKGFNIITGETGAGKSILIDAMGLLLGGRASTDVIRKGATKSIVEGIFNVEGNKKVINLLKENEIDYYPELILRREISLTSSNRCFVNDTPVQLLFVKALGNHLVDLHGQHEHQSLLHSETHIDFLDEFGNYSDLLDEYRNSYENLKKIEKEILTLSESEETLKEKKEIYAYQINEIDNIDPQDGEEERLNAELKIIESSEMLDSLTSEIYETLYESEQSVHDSIVKIKNGLNELSGIDKAFEESSNEAETILALVNDISYFIRSYKSRINIDHSQIEELRNRLGSITMLKKKYGGSIKSILAHRKKIGNEFDLADNVAEKLNELNRNLEKQRAAAGSLAKNISDKRKETAGKIRKSITESLKNLGISNPKFQARVINESGDGNNYVTVDTKSYKCSAKGIDTVEFIISTNLGEDPKPLVKVASGGEISRIMLSLKSTLAKSDKLPLLIFDEIDVGVSGRIAQKVGHALRELAAYHQIIAITHLPQIAGLADHHYKVEKSPRDKRVVSSIVRLTEEERIEEIAKLMSGEEVTQEGITSARQLMNSIN
jgi:DNA repair protein RecN (Recombination protein N)